MFEYLGVLMLKWISIRKIGKLRFVIAADEEMIRNGVRAHLGNVELSEGMVTSYVDNILRSQEIDSRQSL